jgi:hypothetical protein
MIEIALKVSNIGVAYEHFPRKNTLIQMHDILLKQNANATPSDSLSDVPMYVPQGIGFD